MTPNEERAQRGRVALDVYMATCAMPEEDTEDAITDLIGDLLHLAHRSRVSVDTVVKMARKHWQAELVEG